MSSLDIKCRFVWPPLLITLILGVTALFCVVTQEAWLAPSLASAAFSQMLHPDDTGSKPINIAAGQIIGVGAGFLGVWLAGAIHAHPLMGDHDLTYGRALAVSLAVLFASTAQSLTGFKTPAGGATALVAAIGIETVTWIGATRMLVGIAIVTVLGEIARQFLVKQRRAMEAMDRNG